MSGVAERLGRFFRRSKANTESNLMHNRIVWALITVFAGGYAWISGERILYLAFFVMLILPAVSLLLTLVMLKSVKVTQSVPLEIVKNVPELLVVSIHNHSPMPFGQVACIFLGDEHAMEIAESQVALVLPFRSTRLETPFSAIYRGHYKLGIVAIHTVDMCGLFVLKKRVNKQVEITVLPQIIDMSNFPLSMQLLSQAYSRFDIRDEDYASISDIRQYNPTDSIKRVHWKLTHKRNEWLVKVFQSNALNSVSMILDSTRLSARDKERVAIEDRMIEMSISLAKYCLDKMMPVDFKATEGFKTIARLPAEFEVIYKAAGRLRFEEKPSLDSLSILSHVLNEATGYVNAVIITAKLDKDLYERIQNAINNGHLVAVMYFATVMPDRDSERIFELLAEGGAPAFRFEDEVPAFWRKD